MVWRLRGKRGGESIWAGWMGVVTRRARFRRGFGWVVLSRWFWVLPLPYGISFGFDV